MEAQCRNGQTDEVFSITLLDFHWFHVIKSTYALMH